MDVTCCNAAMPDTIARGQADGIGYGKNQSVVTRRIMPNEKIIENTLVDVESGEIVETSPSLAQSEKQEGCSDATKCQSDGDSSTQVEPGVPATKRRVWRKLPFVLYFGTLLALTLAFTTPPRGKGWLTLGMEYITPDGGPNGDLFSGFDRLLQAATEQWRKGEYEEAFALYDRKIAAVSPGKK